MTKENALTYIIKGQVCEMYNYAIAVIFLCIHSILRILNIRWRWGGGGWKGEGGQGCAPPYVCTSVLSLKKSKYL